MNRRQLIKELTATPPHDIPVMPSAAVYVEFGDMLWPIDEFTYEYETGQPWIIVLKLRKKPSRRKPVGAR